jgi:hypothetical protein
MMEENLRRALLLSRGDWSVLVTRPLSAACWPRPAAVVIVALPAVEEQARGSVRRRTDAASPASRERETALGAVSFFCRPRPAGASIRAIVRNHRPASSCLSICCCWRCGPG